MYPRCQACGGIGWVRGPLDQTAAYTEIALGWLALARRVYPLAAMSTLRPVLDDFRQRAAEAGAVLAREIIRNHEETTATTAAEFAATPPPPRASARRDRTVGGPVPDAEGGVVVVAAIGNPGAGEGRRVVDAYKPITGVKLPLVPVPDLAAMRAALAAEFPHADTVIDAVLSDLTGRKTVGLRPTILVGEPGCGKTTFALRLMSAL
jgi:hypothetical protein